MSNPERGNINSSSNAAMQLVAEANNAVSSGVAGAGDWPPKVVWWGAQAFQGGGDAAMDEDESHENFKNSKDAQVARRSRRETGLHRSGRQSLDSVETSSSAKYVKPPDANKPAKDRLDSGIDALLSRRPPQLPDGTDSIYEKLRGERQHLRLMESTGSGAVISSSAFPPNQRTSKLVLAPESESESRSGSRGSTDSTVEDRLVQEAFAYAAKLGGTGGLKASMVDDVSGLLAGNPLVKRGSGKRGGRRGRAAIGRGGGGGNSARRKTGAGSRTGNQKVSAATRTFDRSPLAGKKSQPRRSKA
jgi:hypothetical protein